MQDPCPTDLPFEVERIRHYQANPIDFIVDVLGVPRNLIWSAMHDMAGSLLANRWTAVAGCHNSSKTFTAACLAWWWVICWQPAIVYVTGPKERQLLDTFWAQLRARFEAAPVPLGGQMGSMDWKLTPDTMIVARTARKDTGSGGATGMQGYKSQRLLMIFDEATGIDRQFWESAMGVVTFPENRWLALANPTNPNCGFRDCWRPDSGWNTINIDALANPNLTGGRVVHPFLATPEWVEQARRTWGEGSPSWESRVRGRFPSAAIDTLISIADFEMALDREPAPSLDVQTWVGADIAAQGDDYSVIAVVRNDDLVYLEWFHEPDTTKTGDRIIRVAEEHGLCKSLADHVSIDAGGLGVGVFNHVRRFHKWQIRGEDFGRNAVREDLYADRRTELWVGVRDWLRGPGTFATARQRDMAWIRHLEADLCGCIVDPLYVKGAQTLLKLEKKALMKKRLGHSPDHGDALALALAHRTARKALPFLKKKPEEEESRDRRLPWREDDKARARRRRRAGIHESGGSVGGIFGE